MTHLCINDLSNILSENIYIKNYENKYKIFYKNKNIIISGITFIYNDIIIFDDKIIKLIINNNHKLRLIDNILSKKINNYKSFIHNNYITIKKNNKINSILNKNKDKDNKLYFNISIVNKYNNTPVLYIVK